MMLHSLQSWFEINQRALPWRKEKPNPYEIWISEVMSQQSVLETVKRYFINWMSVFTTVDSLAAADESKVMEQWAGLGYYSRARLVLRTAILLSEQLRANQKWPSTAEEWMTLPGVGPYTAKAIAAIAFGQPVLPMDGNLIRVVARVYGIKDPLNSPRDLQLVKERVAELETALKDDSSLRPYMIAQGFMDLGATVCKPRGSAICEICPIREHGCWAEQNQCVEVIPAAKVRPSPVFLDYVAHPLVNERGEVWVEPIGADSPGNLINQWQIPLTAIDESSEYWSQKGLIRHSITNHRYRVRVSSMPVSESLASSTGRWVNPHKAEVHLSTLSRKILASFFS